MIVSYKDKRTRDFADGRRVKAFFSIQFAARLKLDRLDAAEVLQDLITLPGNRFEALKGDRKGQYSIRINDQWRVCFEWGDGEPWAVPSRDRRLPLGEELWQSPQYIPASISKKNLPLWK